MKQSILTVFAALFLAAGPALAANDAHDHGHAAASATLQLNAGKKWETDAPLRQAMAQIRRQMAGSLHAIHENRLPAKGYDRLALTVEKAVGEMVANCKLGPQADEQLHIIIADLLAGAEQMAGKSNQAKRMDGALKVIDALENYSRYFDDSGFRPITH